MVTDQAYVERWFVDFPTLVCRSGGSATDVKALLSAGAAPAVIYARFRTGDWWSALGTRDGRFPAVPPEGEHWFATAALYWLRRGLLEMRRGATATIAAASNQEAFIAQFIVALCEEPLAPPAFSAAFDGAKIEHGAAISVAKAEWAAWVAGGYAVCLRSFTGRTCVQKESIGRLLRTQRANAISELPDLEVLDLVERLDLLLLPFAPFQRAGGTPGLAIDRLLSLLDLGAAEPYAGLRRRD